MDIRQKILGSQDIKSERVRIEEWDVEVEVRGLNAAQRLVVLEASRDEEGVVQDSLVSIPIVIASVYDPETGKPVFSLEDKEALGTKNASAVDRLAAVALRLSGMSEAAKEEMEKNS